MIAHEQVQHLLDFIDASPSPWHVGNSIELRLTAFRFERLDETQTWNLQAGGRYYVIRDDSSVIAFVLGKKPLPNTGFNLVGAHTDSPGLRLKPKPLLCSDGLLRVAVDVYGSPILATFTDRDLSLAGRIVYRTEQGTLASKLIDFDLPLLRLPNLAIHMNRNVNEEGLKLHKQHELTLMLSQITAQQLPEQVLKNLLTSAIGIDASQLLSWELSVYDAQQGRFWGIDQVFYANSQLDNLASCHAALSALLEEEVLATAENTLVCAFFDHEEVGSESYKGAAGSFLADVLERVALCCGLTREDYLKTLARSFLISADMAHAYQPNFPNAYDAGHKVLVNSGPVIKHNVNQRYATSSLSCSRFIGWCEQAKVPFQHYNHRGDLPCGSTIGPIAATKLGIMTVDVGSPLWAMHSVRESAGVFDHHYLIRVLQCFFTQD